MVDELSEQQIRAMIAKLQDMLPPVEEPPDIRKTNASDDPCPMCQQVHSTDPNTPITCRCLYCGQIGPIAMSTHDPRLGSGVVCATCCGRAAPRNFQDLEQEALARKQRMPWDS